MDRLLAQLADVEAGRWVLSGDQALALRFPSRPQKCWNIDIEWLAWDVDAAEKLLIPIVEHDAGDFFEFDVTKTGSGASGRRGGWNRYRISVGLGEEEFSSLSLTLHSRYSALAAERVLTMGLLEFAGISPVAVNVVILEIQAAELLCRHVQQCERGLDASDLGHLRDLGLIAARSGLDAATLQIAIDQVFALCQREIPSAMPYPFEGWVEWMREMAETAGPPEDFLPGYEGVVSLFGPVLSGEVEEGIWDAAAGAWQEPDSPFDGHLPFA
jgi:hypothetical protein